jgi:hypothetical protein
VTLKEMGWDCCVINFKLVNYKNILLVNVIRQHVDGKLLDERFFGQINSITWNDASASN